MKGLIKKALSWYANRQIKTAEIRFETAKYEHELARNNLNSEMGSWELYSDAIEERNVALVNLLRINDKYGKWK